MPQTNLTTVPTDFAESMSKLLLAQFRAAAELTGDKCVDLNTIGTKPLNDMPSKLTTVFEFGNTDEPFTMEFHKDGQYFGSITALMRIENGKIHLYSMAYEANVKGFAPYAVRHLVSTFRDVHDLVISTGVMGNPENIKNIKIGEGRALVAKINLGKLKLFERIGFQLLDAQTNERVSAPATVEGLKPCRGEFAFDNQETRDAVFKALEMPLDNGAVHIVASSSSSVDTLPIRHAHEPRQRAEAIAVAGR